MFLIALQRKRKKLEETRRAHAVAVKNSKNAVWIKIFEGSFHCRGHIRNVKGNDLKFAK
jgi:hypothetical protein